jgi:O-antigen/teichoic acid export membrane protein
VDDAPELLKDVDPNLIGRRASQGVLYLLLRYGGVQVAGLAANIALSRLLAPSAFGIYAITLGVLVFFAWLSDFGLGAALLQKRAAMTDEDLRSVFTVQQVVLLVLALLVVLGAPQLAASYHLGSSGEWFLRAMALAAVLTSLKTVPNIVMERKLLYGRLTLVEVLEVLLFQVIAVLLAFRGQGPWSFIWAVLISKAAGVVVTFFLAGWSPRLGIHQAALRGLWWFALPFQLTWITYLFRDYLIPVLGGLLLMPVEVGYLNWAFALAGVPGQMAQVVGRVAFPTYSRLQADPARLARAVESSLRALFVIAIPLQLVPIALGRWLIEIVFTSKWMPALLPLYFLSIYWAGANLTTPLVSALNALGRVRVTLLLNIAWTLVQVGLSLALLRVMGYPGIALGFAISRAIAIVAVLALVAPVVPIKLGGAVVPLIASLVVAAAGYGATLVLPPSLLNLILVGCAMAALYGGLLWMLDRHRLRGEIARLLVQLRPAPAGELHREP